jgi:3-hydroxyisobutyrate dehydrogenase-like beta-hydroxyacid dehydrogenase
VSAPPPPVPAERRIAFLGVGKMGLPMAEHLCSAGHDVLAIEPSAERRRVAAARGLRCVAELADAPEDCTLFVSSLPDDAALLAAAARIAAHPGEPRAWIDTSSVSLAASGQAAATAARAGIPHLRATVSGNAAMAAAAGLTVLASGPRELYDDMLPLLQLWGPRQFYLGAAEEARLMKLVINLMVAHTTATLAEALALGQKGGLPWQDLWQVITASAVASPIVQAKAVPLRERDYSPTFTVEQMRKDLGLILGAGRQLGVALPMTQLVDEGQRAAAAAGLGVEDYAAVIKVAERAAGIEA